MPCNFPLICLWFDEKKFKKTGKGCSFNWRKFDKEIMPFPCDFYDEQCYYFLKKEDRKMKSFSNLSTNQLKQMRNELKQVIYQSDCYNWKDFAYLLEIEKELAKRKNDYQRI